MHAGLFTYAWDLDAEGYDNALGSISSAGFTAVNLASAYHAGKFLLPHNPRHRLYFPEDGAIYFSPDSSRYGRIQPRVSSLVGRGRDPLRDLDRERRKHGLELVAWTVCLHNSWLGERFPDCCIHTAFGDPLIHSLSPAHPDVREYIQALVRDIVSAADVTGIQLESPEYMGFEHGYHHEVIGVPLDDSQRLLLSISFSEHEIQRAEREGIDPERLRHQVADALDAGWNRPDDASSALDAVMSNPDFEAYGALLTTIEAEFVSGICDAIHDASPDTEIRFFAGMAASEENTGVPEHFIEHAGGMLTGYMPSDDAVRDRAAKLKSIMGDRPVYGMVRAISPDADHPDQAASRVRAWKESEVDGIDVYNYGFMTRPMIDAVGNALKS